MERRDTFGPDDALVVMAGLDDRAQQTGHADPVGAHVHRCGFAIRPLHGGPHRVGILGAEVENLPNFDPARHAAAVLGDVVEQRLIVCLICAGVQLGEFLHHACALFDVVIINFTVAKGQIGDGAVVKHLRFTGVGQHQKFMRVVPANGA